MLLLRLLAILCLILPARAEDWWLASTNELRIPTSSQVTAYASVDSQYVPAYMLWIGAPYSGGPTNITPIANPTTFKAGTNYYVWARLQEYNNRKFGFYISDAFGTNTQTMNRLDTNGEWTRAGPITPTIDGTNFAIRVDITNGAATDKYLLESIFVTTDPQKAIGSKLYEMAQTFTPPTSYETNVVRAGNILPNSSFELGATAQGWVMYDALGVRPAITSYWANGVSAHGSYSLKSQSRDQIYSPIFMLDHPNRTYTVTAYGKPTSLDANQAILIMTIYNTQKVPTDLGYTQVTNSYTTALQFTDTNSFVRKTFFTNIALFAYPTGTFQIKIERRSNPSTYVPFYVDAIQVEEGPAASAYAPQYPIEMAVRVEVPNKTFLTGDPKEVKILSYNNTGSSSNVACFYEIRNIRNELVQTGSPTLTVPAGNGTNTISLTFTNDGPYRMTFWGGSPDGDEAAFYFLSHDGSTAVRTNSWVGVHSENGDYVVQSVKRLGFDDMRGLTANTWRWGGGSIYQTESSAGVYNFDTNRVATVVTNNMNLLGSMNSNPLNYVPSFYTADITAGNAAGVLAYSNWVYNAVATHYPLGVTDYEDWNEIQRAFSGSPLPTSLQTNITSAFVDAVKAAAPDARVVVFGGVNWYYEATNMWANLTSAQKSNVWAGSFHIYALENTPFTPYVPPIADLDDWKSNFPDITLMNSESGLQVIGGWRRGNDSEFNAYGDSFGRAWNQEERYYRHDFAWTQMTYEIVRNIGRRIKIWFYDMRMNASESAGQNISTTHTGFDADDGLKPHGWYAAKYNLLTKGTEPLGAAITNNGVSSGITAYAFNTGSTNFLILLNRGYSLCRLTVSDTNFTVLDAEGNSVTREDLTKVDLGRWPQIWWSTSLTTNQLVSTFSSASVASRTDVTAPNVSVDWSPNGTIQTNMGVLRMKVHAVDDEDIPCSVSPATETNLVYAVKLSGRDADFSDYSPTTLYTLNASDLSEETTYRWMVRARDSSGNIGTASGPEFFLSQASEGGGEEPPATPTTSVKGKTVRKGRVLFR